MPLTRSQLPTVAGFDRRLHLGNAIERGTSRFARWLLGAGFLAVDLALFGTSLLVAYVWALIAHPGDLDSINPFRYWGVVAVVHTLVAGGGLLAWKLLGMDEPATRTAIPAYQPVPARGQYALSTWSQSQPVDAIYAQPQAAAPRRTAWASRPVEQNWPQQPELLRTQPGTTTDPDLGEATWPENVPLSTSLGVSGSASESGERPSPSQSWFDSFMGSRGASQKEKEQRWSWVEAAAGSWLSRREPTTPPTTDTTADAPIADAAAQPLDDDQQPHA